MPRPRKPASPFRYFNSSSEVIRLVAMLYVRFPLSLRHVEDLLAEGGIDICHETVRHWGTGSARCSRAMFASNGPAGCEGFATGASLSTRCT